MAEPASHEVPEIQVPSHPPRGFSARLTALLDRAVCLAWLIFGAFFVWSSITGNEHHVVLFLAHTFAPYGVLCSVIIGICLGILLYRHRRLPLPLTCGVVCVFVGSVVSTVRGYEQVGFAAAPALNDTETSSFTILDANLLGFRDVQEGFFDEVARLTPDIIAVQELNERAAQRLRERFGLVYPCQVVAAAPGSQGMGVFARYPCVEHTVALGAVWTGLPQVVEVAFPSEARVIVANMHPIPPHAVIPSGQGEGIIAQLSANVGLREEGMARLLQFLTPFRGNPVIMAGDLNATSRSAVYAMVRRAGFTDAWAIGDPLMGGTWPHSDWGFLSWIFRIDFIFHSSELETRRVDVLKDSFGSDHRGVVTTLQRKQPKSADVSRGT